MATPNRPVDLTRADDQRAAKRILMANDVLIGTIVYQERDELPFLATVAPVIAEALKNWCQEVVNAMEEELEE